MRGKRAKKPGYTALQRKIFTRIALTAVISVAAIILLRILVSGWMGNFIVDVLQRFFGMTWMEASDFYRFNIRNNIDLIIIAAIVVVFLVLSRFLFVQFSKYFGEISNGLDALIEDKDEEIALSPEMISMERKLNAVRLALKKREYDAKQEEQRKNDMVMYLAHDIKTPLTSVIGYLSLLDEAADLPIEQKANYTRITLDKAIRLEKLVDEFFEITRYNFQTPALSKEKIDVRYMLAQMADEFYPLLAARGKEIALQVPESLTVQGDRDKLARVFNNILKNAAAYSPDNSIINITAFVSDNTAVVEFKNIGSIPKDKLSVIFDKFFRLDSARSTEAGGAGLGLAIAKEIIAAHGGRILADSDGTHTAFTVELPLSS